MWNFCEIYSDNAQRATLVTAVLSVVAAVVVVFLTHTLAQRRSRIELRAKKLEEIYEATTAFANAGWKYIHERISETDQALEIMSAYAETHSKLDMLTTIYANDISSEVEAMNLLVILTKDKGKENASLFPDRLQSFVEGKSSIQRKIATKARALT